MSIQKLILIILTHVAFAQVIQSVPLTFNVKNDTNDTIDMKWVAGKPSGGWHMTPKTGQSAVQPKKTFPITVDGCLISIHIKFKNKSWSDSSSASYYRRGTPVWCVNKQFTISKINKKLKIELDKDD